MLTTIVLGDNEHYSIDHFYYRKTDVQRTKIILIYDYEKEELQRNGIRSEGYHR